MRSNLLKDKQVRFYMCADLDKLNEHMVNNGNKKLESIWLEHFPASLKHNDQHVCITNQPFNVLLTWCLKKESELVKLANESFQNQPKIFAQTPKKDFIINLGNLLKKK